MLAWLKPWRLLQEQRLLAALRAPHCVSGAHAPQAAWHAMRRSGASGSCCCHITCYNEGLMRGMVSSPGARQRSTVLVLRARLHAALQCGVS